MTLYGIENYQGSCEGNEQKIADYFFEHPNQISITYQEHNQLMWLKGEDVSQAIRKPEVNKQLKYIPDHPDCRAFVDRLMRDIARRFSVVIEGRDIGTKVFPNADYKFYLDAKPEIRAVRRAKEMGVPLEGTEFEALLQEIKNRDQNDRNREIAPLQLADDAILVDTSDLEIKSVIRAILDKINVETKYEEI